jgi:hypothetical protein
VEIGAHGGVQCYPRSEDRWWGRKSIMQFITKMLMESRLTLIAAESMDSQSIGSTCLNGF